MKERLETIKTLAKKAFDISIYANGNDEVENTKKLQEVQTLLLSIEILAREYVHNCGR